MNIVRIDSSPSVCNGDQHPSPFVRLGPDAQDSRLIFGRHCVNRIRNQIQKYLL